MVEFLYENEEIRNEMQNSHLRAFPDLEKLYAKFYRVQANMRNSASLLDCVKVYNMIHTLESLVSFLNENVIDENHVLRTKIIAPLTETLEEFAKLKTMLE